MKPKFIDVLTIIFMKKQVTELYEEIDKRVSDIHNEFGEGRYDYEIGSIDVEGELAEFAEEMKEKGNYFKFEIENNITSLMSGESVFKSVSVKPVSFSSRSLKRKPESLK